MLFPKLPYYDAEVLVLTTTNKRAQQLRGELGEKFLVASNGQSLYGLRVKHLAIDPQADSILKTWRTDEIERFWAWVEQAQCRVGP